MKELSSFRDPDGFIFYKDDKLYRAVAESYKNCYDHFISSGLYDKLVREKYIVPHKEIEPTTDGIYKVLEPEIIDFISYPYEWSFSQLKDAAILTLEIQKTALELGMSLKDASAYNIQFQRGKPVFIDTLSFELYETDRPWNAYRQFCQHFLAPMALMAFRDVRLNGLTKNHIDGIPLDLAKNLLPLKTWFRFGILMHLHLHAVSQKKYNSNTLKVSELNRKFSKQAFFLLLGSLKRTISGINWKYPETEWGSYYETSGHSTEYEASKKEVVSGYLNIVKPAITWDIGSNTGIFSRLAAEKGGIVIAFDIDPVCIERLYKETKTRKEENILPLLLDLANPSPSLGWACSERKSINERAKCDLLMALALIHHLAISNNLPFEMIAGNFSKMAKRIIIEFVPKEDEKVQLMLTNRMDIFRSYSIETFEAAFCRFYDIEQKSAVEHSKRTLYLMRSKIVS